jgi:cyclic beta-1,2-glucan synthetase
MKAVSDRLVQEEDALILLFTPPFDRMVRDPGYIRGYVPGIRENGGQYTHAAIWAVWAFAALAGDGNTDGETGGDNGGDKVWRLFNLINPIRHADQPEKMLKYKVEPYVIAADVYGRPPHTGRGGWTWYTGSSGWMYSLGIEAILGLHKRGDRLLLDPCIPTSWESYQVHYRVGDCQLHIQVQNPYGVSKGVSSIRVDGIECKDLAIPLDCSAGNHQVVVTLGGENVRQD